MRLLALLLLATLLLGCGQKGPLYLPDDPPAEPEPAEEPEEEQGDGQRRP